MYPCMYAVYYAYVCAPTISTKVVGLTMYVPVDSLVCPLQKQPEDAST